MRQTYFLMKLLKTIFLSIFLVIFSCKKENNTIKDTYMKSSIKHAKGFDIQYFDNYKKIIIKSPYPDAKEQFEYILIANENSSKFKSEAVPVIHTPVEKIVVTSTTHIPMLELLDEENSLIGFPNLQYISSEKTVKNIQQGNIRELGKGEHINTEVLIDIAPEVVVSFSMTSANKIFSTIEKAGIPVLLNGDWLEETPLGRAEWIKFFGALYNKEKEADSIFRSIEQEYLQAIEIAKNAEKKPTVLSGVMFKDSWNLPAGESFVAQFLKDANTNYLWSDTKGKGSLSLNFETVYEKGQNAEFWIAPGHYKSLKELSEANDHYTQFEAFKANNIYSFANTTGTTGGVLYYELAPVQPQIVLKDIIKIMHPELLPNYQPFFLKKLQ